MTSETKTGISITRDNLPKVIAKAFDLSVPQGMGFLHFKEGGIPEGVLIAILSQVDEAETPYFKRVSMDYVQGRAVKLHIQYDENEQKWRLDGDRWYDHSGAAWQELKDYAESLQA